MSAIRVKKGDQVLILAGKDRAKRGAISEVMPGKRKVAVEGVNVLKRHLKPRGPGKPAGIVEFNAPLDLSNVMVVCPKCDQPTRIGMRVLADGSKMRACKKCGEVMDE